jgi:hypothetical protein
MGPAATRLRVLAHTHDEAETLELLHGGAHSERDAVAMTAHDTRTTSTSASSSRYFSSTIKANEHVAQVDAAPSAWTAPEP